MTQTRTMRRAQPEDVPFDGSTAIQQDADRPVFRGNGPYDYLCAACGNVLAATMAPEYMSKKVRVRCGRCRTVNVAVEEPGIDYSRPPARRAG
jgi:phage FluMu protein Com